MASKVNEFLKEMTEATGLYGDDLFAFIRKKCLPEKVEEKKEEEAFFPQGEYTFTGSITEFKEFYLLHGGNEEIAKFFGCCAPGLAAVHAAALLKKEKFAWVKPTKIWKGTDNTVIDGWCKYSCWYKPNTGKYDFDEGQIVKNFLGETPKDN